MDMKSLQSGYLLVVVLVFGSVFLVMATAFVGYIVTQSQITEMRIQRAKALNIAEAGLDYYKWYLAHNPNDMTNGTGAEGPYVHVYNDPEGGPIGEFSLEIASSSFCGEVYAVDITSTGHTYEDPDVQRVVYGRYAKPTVAEYSYIINSNVWAGPDRTIIGPYHSNGVIRMDGTNNSTVTSGQGTWKCNSNVLPCEPTGATLNGVYGDGSNDDLWTYPVPPIDFGGLTLDLDLIKQKAQAGGGVYIGPSNAQGYRVRFNANGTIDLYRVTHTTEYWGYTQEADWQKESHVIRNSTFVRNYAIPSACPLVYVEDKVWIDGAVSGKVTIAAANGNTGVNPSIILNDNVTYAHATSGLLAIAEQDVLVGLQVPSVMTLNGIFVAQNGRFGRNHYCDTDCSDKSGSQALPATLAQYEQRNTLTINGTIVSNGREGTRWVQGSVFTSGFNTRYNSYDRDLVANPPPLTPEVSDTYEFIEWREVE